MHFEPLYFALGSLTGLGNCVFWKCRLYILQFSKFETAFTRSSEMKQVIRMRQMTARAPCCHGTGHG